MKITGFILKSALAGILMCYSLALLGQETIIVQGSAGVDATPDVLNFHVVIEERGNLLTKLSKVLDAKTEKTIDELTKNNIPPAHIQSLNISVFPWFERENNQSVQKGFVVSRQINVKLDDFTLLDGLIDRILRIGVKSVGGFRHSVKNEEEIYQQALGKAVLNARDNAAAMLAVVGRKPGDVIRLQQLSRGHAIPAQRAFAMAEADTAWQPGQMSVQAEVQVEFTISQ